MYVVVVAEILDFEEFTALDLSFQPESPFNEVGADLVHARESDLHHEGDTGFYGMQLDWPNLSIFVYEKPKQLTASFRFSF